MRSPLSLLFIQEDEHTAIPWSGTCSTTESLAVTSNAHATIKAAMRVSVQIPIHDALEPHLQSKGQLTTLPPIFLLYFRNTFFLVKN